MGESRGPQHIQRQVPGVMHGRASFDIDGLTGHPSNVIFFI